MTAAARERTRLVADVGGTHLRLGLVVAPGGAPEASAVLPRAEHRDLRSAVERYLQGVARRHQPSSACVAVAAPVSGDEVRLTNADFAFRTEQTRCDLGLERLLVVNDVQALARSVDVLDDAGAHRLAGGPLRPERTVAVVAPGTGLGVAALHRAPAGPVVLPGEGGQVPLPATVPAALPVAAALLEEQGHVSAEDLVSGTGLPRLDVVLRRLQGEPDPRPRSARDITRDGVVEGGALEVFVALLAAVAQSAVLTLGARGGLVLGGGFLPEMVPVLRACGFAERFASHPKMHSYLREVPVLVDVRQHPALHGAALLLEDAA